MVGSFVLSLLALCDVATGHPVNVPLYTWLTSGNLDIHIGISIDRLTAVMLVLVTTVSTLVHIYTIGYMQENRDTPASSPISPCSPFPC